ncbi:hypothetical protein B296_00019659, partial [Ensete ventricosum]
SFSFEDPKIPVPLYIGVHVVVLPFFIPHRSPLVWQPSCSTSSALVAAIAGRASR